MKGAQADAARHLLKVWASTGTLHHLLLTSQFLPCEKIPQTERGFGFGLGLMYFSALNECTRPSRYIELNLNTVKKAISR